MRRVDPLLVEMIESLPTTPAIVADERFDIVASNALARAISPSLAVGVNLAEATFANDSARRTLTRWDHVSAQMVGLLKDAMADRDPGTDGTRRQTLETLRAELARRSAAFADAWREGHPSDDFTLPVAMEHPEVGRLEITYEILRLPGSGEVVVMGHTAPGSISEQHLFELAARCAP